MTELFKRTLGDQASDLYRIDRERLRSAYINCRDKAATLSAEISRDLPSYTVHDITHLDALWETAELIAGKDYPLNPMEGLILGCAFLVHDLAMTKAAFPEGIENVIGSARWKDSLYAKFGEIYARQPTTAEIECPPTAVVQAAESDLLRELHAEQAIRLMHQPFADASGGSSYYLLDDPDLRNTYGELIGRIAASHWWSISKIASEFSSIFGGRGSFPSDWTVDPLKLACLVRAADASHIDSRRAPGFLRAIRGVSDESRAHWIFQERLLRPWLDQDRLIYTSSQPFLPAQAESWWLCVETLRMVDSELRSIDSLLADTDRSRFKARSVGHIGDLDQLARLIPVRDWFPVDARIKVGNVISLVNRLGGAELYGDNPRIAIRELISNAADAIRARRALTRTGDDELRMRVHIRVRHDGTGTWLHIRDNGIGMTKEVMSGPLLDFGESYWRSAAAVRDLPGLLSSGFRPTGRFGIGFFAAFMLGNKIEVASRRFDRGEGDTYVLTFDNGLGSRPLLRRALAAERLRFGGTDVSVEIPDDALEKMGLGDGRSLREFISQLCPAMDVNIDIDDREGKTVALIRENDWLEMPASELLARLYPDRDMSRVAAHVRPVIGPDGSTIGRAMIDASSSYHRIVHGVIVVGGLCSESSLSHIAGVFVGETSRAARDVARPIVTLDSLAVWASEQAELCLAESPARHKQQLFFAQLICMLGGDVTDLAVAESADGLLTFAEVVEWARNRNKIRLVQDVTVSLATEYRKSARFVLDPDVLSVPMGTPVIYQTHRNSRSRVDDDWEAVQSRGLQEACISAVARAWEDLEGYVARQVDERNRIMRESNALRAYSDDVDKKGDSEHSRREVVGTFDDGETVESSVECLVRMYK